MEVNRELPNLADGLDESVHVIGPGGRVLVLAYHSLEDRMVKERFARWAGNDADRDVRPPSSRSSPPDRTRPCAPSPASRCGRRPKRSPRIPEPRAPACVRSNASVTDPSSPPFPTSSPECAHERATVSANPPEPERLVRRPEPGRRCACAADRRARCRPAAPAGAPHHVGGRPRDRGVVVHVGFVPRVRGAVGVHARAALEGTARTNNSVTNGCAIRSRRSRRHRP